MNTPKAIEILADILRYVQPPDLTDEHDAIKLGFEALQREEARRHSIYWSAAALFPGETD